jgi:hypothetical protein
MASAKKESQEIATVQEAGAKGGKATAARLSDEERRERAKKAAAARWNDNLPRATHGDLDHPLRIAGIEIACFVLSDERRVISQRALQTGIGMNVSGGAQRLLNLVGSLEGKGIDIKDLTSRIKEPIRFRLSGGVIAHGYEATALADICDVILAARKAGFLRKQQLHVADQCEILVRGFARVGIVALVDEATGYQYERSRDNLRRILEQYVSKELARWERTFEPDFYRHLHRLKGWNYNPTSTQRSHAVAKLTVDLTYHRIHPDLEKELKQVRSDGEKPNSKLFQWLTQGPNGGHPRLKQHLEGITALMKVADNWAQFKGWVDQHYPLTTAIGRKMEGEWEAEKPSKSDSGPYQPDLFDHLED